MNELGKLIEGSECRDAVHVAIIPMEASEMLRPGQRVGIVSDGIAGPSSKALGVVDPFLDDVVPKGKQFWLCLFPNSISDMRHAWVHPDFKDDVAEHVDEHVQGVIENTKVKQKEIEEWMKKQADILGCDVYDLLDINGDILSGEYIITYMNESARDYWAQIYNEYQEKIEDYHGIPFDDIGGFSCSC